MRADGSVITVDIRRQEFELAGRRVALVSCIDVSDKLLAEERLRQGLARLRRSEERLARAQEVSRTGSIERDLKTGAIRIMSTLGQGTAVHIRLPLADATDGGGLSAAGQRLVARAGSPAPDAALATPTSAGRNNRSCRT
jgi:hypothetical protein